MKLFSKKLDTCIFKIAFWCYCIFFFKNTAMLIWRCIHICRFHNPYSNYSNSQMHAKKTFLEWDQIYINQSDTLWSGCNKYAIKWTICVFQLVFSQNSLHILCQTVTWHDFFYDSPKCKQILGKVRESSVWKYSHVVMPAQAHACTIPYTWNDTRTNKHG